MSEKIEELLCYEHSGDDYPEDYGGECPICKQAAEIERLQRVVDAAVAWQQSFGKPAEYAAAVNALEAEVSAYQEAAR